MILVELAVDDDHQRQLIRKRSADREGRARLRHEAMVLRASRHPGVVEVHRYREQVEADGTVLDLRAAGDLTLEGLPPTSAAAAAGILASLATTVADLHEVGVVHGRIEPSHVVLSESGLPLLCGFGGATLLTASTSDPTGGAATAGDVFGLGLLLAEMVGFDGALEPIPDRRWQRRPKWHGYQARALLNLADHATQEDPRRRPSARALAAAIHESVPDAALTAVASRGSTAGEPSRRRRLRSGRPSARSPEPRLDPVGSNPLADGSAGSDLGGVTLSAAIPAAGHANAPQRDDQSQQSSGSPGLRLGPTRPLSSFNASAGASTSAGLVAGQGDGPTPGRPQRGEPELAASAAAAEPDQPLAARRPPRPPRTLARATTPTSPAEPAHQLAGPEQPPRPPRTLPQATTPTSPAEPDDALGRPGPPPRPPRTLPQATAATVPSGPDHPVAGPRQAPRRPRTVDDRARPDAAHHEPAVPPNAALPVAGRATARRPSPRRTHRVARPRALATVLLSASAALLVVVVLTRRAPGPVHRSARSPRAAPSTDPRGEAACPTLGGPAADIDGRRCGQPVVVQGRVLSVGSARFTVGRDGDQVVVGDWDCRGRVTPAVVRPSTGEVFVFHTWGRPGQEVTVHPTAVVALATAPMVTTHPGSKCAVLSIRRRAGQPVVVDAGATR